MISSRVKDINFSIDDKSAMCQRYLKILYQNVQAQRLLDNAHKNNIAEVYGEVIASGVDKLIANYPFTTNDVFYDWGSGLGKIVLQVFMMTEVRAAKGIEIVPDLHRYAQSALEQMKIDLPGFFSAGRQLEFIEGSFLDVPVQDATIVLTGSPCFPSHLISQIGQRIEETPSIHTVFTLRPFLNLKRLTFKHAIKVQCSWDAALCYVYSR